MGHDDRNDPTIAAAPGRARRRRRLFLLAGGAVVGLAVVLTVVVLADRFWRAADAADPFVPGALDDYVPEDSEAVLAVDLRAVRESAVGRAGLAPALRRLADQGPRRLRWMEQVGVRPSEDLDSLLVSFAPGSGGQPLWLLRSRLDRSRFRVGPDGLTETRLDSFPVWASADRRGGRTTLLAPVGDTLVAGETPGRVRAALVQASRPGPVTVRDATLRGLLAEVDRKQTLWLAATTASLNAVGEVDNFFLKLVLGPLRQHARGVHGGVTCGDDLRAELVFQSPSAEEAERLESALQSLCETAGGAALFLGRQKELAPLLRLLAGGQTSRQGDRVRLRCRLAADQIGGG